MFDPEKSRFYQVHKDLRTLPSSRWISCSVVTLSDLERELQNWGHNLERNSPGGKTIIDKKTNKPTVFLYIDCFYKLPESKMRLIIEVFNYDTSDPKTRRLVDEAVEEQELILLKN